MSNIQTGAERMPHDLSHLGFLAGQIGRLITISTTPVIAGDSFEMRSEERFSRNAETDLVCRLLLEKKKTSAGCTIVLAMTSISLVSCIILIFFCLLMLTLSSQFLW